MFLILIYAVIFQGATLQEIKLKTLIKNEEVCRNVTKEPYFLNEKVVGTIWRVYFAWNMMLEDRCIDVFFKTVTISMIDRYQRLNQDYMNSTPKWRNATFLMTLNVTREMLLIPDDTFFLAGRFVGIPNIHKANNIENYRKRDVSVFSIAMKLLNEGRYLIISDCQNGVTTFLVRRDQKHTRAEMKAALKYLSFSEDPGFPACQYYFKKKKHYH